MVKHKFYQKHLLNEAVDILAGVYVYTMHYKTGNLKLRSYILTDIKRWERIKDEVLAIKLPWYSWGGTRALQIALKRSIKETNEMLSTTNIDLRV